MDIDTAKDFLQRTFTVVGRDEAIEDKDEKFLTRYATVVGSSEAIETVCDDENGGGSGDENP